MSRRRPSVSRLSAVPAALPTALLAAVLVGCGPGSEDAAGTPGHAGPPRPNVLLIVLDTVRADHLGCYGYSRPTSPVLDQLASDATLYTGTRATSPWSLPSHASIFTGLYPFEHGAHTEWVDIPEDALLADPDKDPTALPDNVRPLPVDRPTLAEELKQAGYHTAAIVANDAFLDPIYGLDRGFDEYEVERQYAPDVNRRVESWLTERDDRPFFLFLNYMDAHVPYNPRPVPRLAEPDNSAGSRRIMSELRDRILAQSGAPPGPLLEVLTAQYDRGIANLDAGLGELFRLLERQGLYDDLLLIITSDHGEYLGEHQLIAHSKDVYEPVMWIPLIVKHPGQRAGRLSDELVSLVHLPRLILDGVEGAHTAAFPYVQGDGASILGENYYTRWRDLLQPWGRRFERVRRVLYRGDLKYISSSDGAHELYDLSADVHELQDLIEAQSAVARHMADELLRHVSDPHASLPAFEERVFTDEERERLEALGYL